MAKKKIPARWADYLHWFMRGFRMAWIARRFRVHEETVEEAIRQILKAQK